MFILNGFFVLSLHQNGWLSLLHTTNSLTAFENKYVFFLYFQSVLFITTLTVFWKSVIGCFSIKRKLVPTFKSESYIRENKFYLRELRIYKELTCVLERFQKSKVCLFLLCSCLILRLGERCCYYVSNLFYWSKADFCILCRKSVVLSRHRALTEGQSQRIMGAPRGTQGRERQMFRPADQDRLCAWPVLASYGTFVLLRLRVPERSEQRGALAAVCTPTIKSASEKHQSDTPLGGGRRNCAEWLKTVN